MKWLKSCFSGCFYLILLLVIVAFFLKPYVVEFLSNLDLEGLENQNQLQANEEINPDEIEVDEIEVEEIEVETLEDENTPNSCAISDARYKRAWKDLSNNKTLSLQLTVEGGKRCQAQKNRDKFLPKEWQSDGDYWRQVYVPLIDFDSPKMKSVLSQFKQLKEDKNLDYPEFAEAIITFIQNIPYVLVLTKPASEAVADSQFYRDYIQKEKRPYIENIKFGLHSPIEFLHTKQGDCDTRTVLAYSILSYFGYDVAIVNNPEHSMIGINIPSQGTYLKYQGKKYFIWETTSVGWVLGSISPDYNNNLFICVPSLNDI